MRLDTEIMLVDDPVKRVDNMTMAGALEARTPFIDHDLTRVAFDPGSPVVDSPRNGRGQDAWVLG